MIANTAAGVPQSPFQANKRLASPVISGTLSVSHPFSLFSAKLPIKQSHNIIYMLLNVLTSVDLYPVGQQCSCYWLIRALIT